MGPGQSRRRGDARSWLLLALLWGCSSAPSPTDGPAGPGFPVEVAPVSTEDVSVVIEAVGSLEADQQVELKVQRSGRIRALPVSEGEQVLAGTTLVELDDRDVAARVDQAAAALAEAEVRRANAERTYERNRTLRRTGVASEQAYDDSRAEYDRSQAALEVARANRAFAEAELAKSRVVAPFDGHLGRLLVDAGAFVDAGRPLGLLVDDDPLEIVFAVPERYVARVRAGLPVEVKVSSLPGKPFPGRVSFVDPAVDLANRTVLLKAEVPNGEGLLRPGQFANVTVELERHEDATVIPEAAIVPTAERLVVFVVEGEEAAARTVRTGVRLPGRVEITDGLSKGEKVVVAGHEKLPLDRSAEVRSVEPVGG
jgi:membrane fusion protein (multidrug efflux system)